MEDWEKRFLRYQDRQIEQWNAMLIQLGTEVFWKLSHEERVRRVRQQAETAERTRKMLEEIRG